MMKLLAATLPSCSIYILYKSPLFIDFKDFAEESPSVFLKDCRDLGFYKLPLLRVPRAEFLKAHAHPLVQFLVLNVFWVLYYLLFHYILTKGVKSYSTSVVLAFCIQILAFSEEWILPAMNKKSLFQKSIQPKFLQVYLEALSMELFPFSYHYLMSTAKN